MTQPWDEFAKSLAEPLPRRESLRQLGLVITGAVLGPLGLESASAGKADPCKSFCRCGNKRQQDQCLRACKACKKNFSRLGGNCGNYFCCRAGQTPCGSYCADLASDADHCGACGFACPEPGDFEYGACVDGECRYACIAGAVYCDGACTFLDSDENNCGACGNVCGSNSDCYYGECYYVTGEY
jgi:hypothetical protein